MSNTIFGKFENFQKFFQTLRVAYLTVKKYLIKIDNFRKFINIKFFKYPEYFSKIYVNLLSLLESTSTCENRNM